MEGSGDVLWAPGALAEVTKGRWLVAPGESWRPKRVRRPLPGPSFSFDDINVLVPSTYKKLLEGGNAGPPAATGCVVVPQRLYDAGFHFNVPVLMVQHEDSTTTGIARAARARVKGKVVAVSGSVGKTTVRHMLLSILRSVGRVATNNLDGNLSWQIMEAMGSVDADTDYVVLEVGLGEYKGSLGFMTSVVRPDCAVLTQIGVAHIDIFEDAEADEYTLLRRVLGQKLDIFAHLQGPRLAVVNRDIRLFGEAAEAIAPLADRLVSFGEDPLSNVRLLGTESRGSETVVRALVADRTVEYRIGAPGKFMAVNSLAALAAAQALGVDLDQATDALDGFRAVPGRADVIPLTINGVDITLIDDSFNSTPISVRSTFQLLESFKPGGGGRRIAVLGDIAHLGKDSAKIHARLATDAIASGVDQIYTYGGEMLHLQKALPSEMAAGSHETREDLVAAVISSLRQGDVITVKASMPSGFDKVVKMLKEAADRRFAN